MSATTSLCLLDTDGALSDSSMSEVRKLAITDLLLSLFVSPREIKMPVLTFHLPCPSP